MFIVEYANKEGDSKFVNCDSIVDTLNTVAKHIKNGMVVIHCKGVKIATVQKVGYSYHISDSGSVFTVRKQWRAMNSLVGILEGWV